MLFTCIGLEGKRRFGMYPDTLITCPLSSQTGVMPWATGEIIKLKAPQAPHASKWKCCSGRLGGLPIESLILSSIIVIVDQNWSESRKSPFAPPFRKQTAFLVFHNTDFRKRGQFSYLKKLTKGFFSLSNSARYFIERRQCANATVFCIHSWLLSRFHTDLYIILQYENSKRV